jgi:hypothetical protein
MYRCKLAMAVLFVSAPAFSNTVFTAGNLVVAVEGNGVQGAASGPYTDNQAAPLTLAQYTIGGAYVNSLVLPQTASGLNFPVSGELGSSSEGTLQLSGNGQYLTIMGYGVNAAAFNANPGSFGPDPGNTALGQSGSMTGQGYTAVPRVAALIDANGNVNSTTGLYNIFNTNNPRSAFTLNGTTFYVSGQGTSADNTGGVFLATLGASSATSITGNDASSTTSQDTREVQIYNNTLYTSVDSKSGSTNRDYIGTLGGPGLPTAVANNNNGPTMLTGFGNKGGTGKLTITTANSNGLNVLNTEVNLSPENYFFAAPNVLYVADSGSPKNDSVANDKGMPTPSSLGDGGLQKWVNSKADGSGTWTLDYTLAAGLGLVPNNQPDNPVGDDTTGLYGLTGMVVGGNVELFATNYTIGDIDPTYLYGITDVLSATTAPAGESFTQLAAAPANSTFKGVSFAPTAVPEPASFILLGLGTAALLLAARWRKRV